MFFELNFDLNFKLIFYIAFGYLSGSILYAPLFGRLLARTDITQGSADGNPGTANAFLQGGIPCGILTLIFELGKGFLPVWLFVRSYPTPSIWLALVMAAPVVGHILPLFHHFRGGKAVAVSFGSLLGLYPYGAPVLTLAAVFLMFSLVIIISPNYQRTLATYVVYAVVIVFTVKQTFVRLGAHLISACILGKMLTSDERRGSWHVRIPGLIK